MTSWTIQRLRLSLKSQICLGCRRIRKRVRNIRREVGQFIKPGSGINGLTTSLCKSIPWATAMFRNASICNGRRSFWGVLDSTYAREQSHYRILAYDGSNASETSSVSDKLVMERRVKLLSGDWDAQGFRLGDTEKFDTAIPARRRLCKTLNFSHWLRACFLALTSISSSSSLRLGIM